jgi:hypothetical protein
MRCASCGKLFPLSSVASPASGEEPPFVLPAEPADTGESATPATELLDVLPADPAKVSASLAPAPRAETDKAQPPAPAEASFDPAELRLYRYNVYAMLVNACHYYKHKGLVVIVGLGLVPVAAVCAAMLCFLLTWAGYGLTTALGSVLGEGTNYLLYGVVLVVFAYAKVIKSMFDEANVCFKYQGDTPEQLELGRLEDVLGVVSPATNGFFLGACFGFQVGLLYFTPNHGGLGDVGGLGHCFLLTLDNAFHGLFLYTAELYNLHLAGRVEHGWLSATVYYVFRLAFDASALLLVYQIYQRRQARRLFDHYPQDDNDRAAFADWLVKLFGDEQGWPRRYFDEFMFLLIAGYYLQGNNDRVRQLTHDFPRLRVTADVRSHFVDETGTVIFESVR